MTGTRRVSLCLTAVLVLISAGVASAQTTIPIAEEQVLYEAIGEFNNSGNGEFYQQVEINGRTVLVRFIWSGITPNSAHFEQAFSADGGRSWEVNWITDQTRATTGLPNF